VPVGVCGVAPEAGCGTGCVVAAGSFEVVIEPGELSVLLVVEFASLVETVEVELVVGMAVCGRMKYRAPAITTKRAAPRLSRINFVFLSFCLMSIMLSPILLNLIITVDYLCRQNI
jgi:hypothetical protein